MRDGFGIFEALAAASAVGFAVMATVALV